MNSATARDSRLLTRLSIIQGILCFCQEGDNLQNINNMDQKRTLDRFILQVYGGHVSQLLNRCKLTKIGNY